MHFANSIICTFSGTFISCFLHKCNDINLSILDKLLIVEEIMKDSNMGFLPNSYFHLSLVWGFVVLRIEVFCVIGTCPMSYVLVNTQSCFCNYLRCYRSNPRPCAFQGHA